MSTDNRIIVMRILDQVQDGLGEYVLMKYRQRYGGERLKKLVESVKGKESIRGPLLKSDEELLRSFDVASWLKAVTRHKEVFRDELGNAPPGEYREFNRVNAFNFAYELLSTRNAFAHSSARDQFDDDGVYRVAENATRLLVAVGRQPQAQTTERILRSVGKRIYDSADESELSTAKSQVDNLKENLRIAEHAFEDLSNELVIAKEDLKEARRDARSTQANLASANKELTVARQNENDAKNESTAVKKKLRSVERRLAATEKELAEHKTNEPCPMSGSNSNLNEQLLGPNLSGRNMSGKNLSGKDLSRANLTRANLCGANLSGVILRDADLSDADLTDAILFRADFTGAKLTGVKLQGVRYEETLLPNGELWTQATNMRPFTTR